MNNCRWREFVEDEHGRGSAARLNMVLGVIIGSFTIIWLTVKGTLGGEIFATFMLATGGVYGFGKWRESVENVEQTKANSPNPPPVIIPPAPPVGPTTVIQVGDTKPKEQVKDVNIAAQGDVNVRQDSTTS